MRKYHILFNDLNRNFYSTGQNFEAESPVDAIDNFRVQYPHATFIGLYDLDSLNSLHINRKFIQDQVDIEERYNRDIV